MKSRTVTATEFKARCLALIDEIAESGETITVTKRGKPVAQLAPPARKPWKDPAGSWAGKIEIVGDRLGEFARDYRVNFQDGDVGSGVQGIVDEIMNIGETSAQRLIAKTLNNALKSLFVSTVAGEEERQLFKVVFEKVAIVRYDLYVWRYTVRSDGLFKQTKSVVAYTYARGVVDHSKVSIDELNDAIAQSMPDATLEEIAAFKLKLQEIYNAQKSLSPDAVVAQFEQMVSSRRAEQELTRLSSTTPSST